MSDSMSGHVSDDYEMSDVKEISKNLSPKSSTSPAPAVLAAGRLPSSPPPISGSTTSSRNNEDSDSLGNDVEVITVSSRDNYVEPPETTVPIIIKTEHTPEPTKAEPNSKPPSAGPSTLVGPASHAVTTKPKSTKVARPR